MASPQVSYKDDDYYYYYYYYYYYFQQYLVEGYFGGLGKKLSAVGSFNEDLRLDNGYQPCSLRDGSIPSRQNEEIDTGEGGL